LLRTFLLPNDLFKDLMTIFLKSFIFSHHKIIFLTLQI
jgi:hypothetical protein